MNIIQDSLDRGVLISPELKEKAEKIGKDIFYKNLLNYSEKGALVLTKESFSLFETGEFPDINWKEFESSISLFEKGRENENYKVFLDIINYNLSEKTKKQVDKVLEEIKEPQNGEIEKEDIESSVVVLKSYVDESKKREVQDFVMHFRVRYNKIKEILQTRQDLQNVISISRAKNKGINEPVALIGLVSEIQTTKSGHLKIKIEDPTDTIFVLISKTNDSFVKAQDIVLDEVIGISGAIGDKIVFGKELFFPEVPFTKELKKAEEEVYAIIAGDMHVGSILFLEKQFMNFVNWINGEYGNAKQRKIASKVKYLFLVGDIVDGVGIYPGQENELNIRDIRGQYSKVAELLSKIRKDIKIIISSGNHDALRIAEPQPPQPKEYAQPLYEMENVFIVSNPAVVNIHASKDFPGFDFLIYHGYSYDFYADSVERIRLMKPNISERIDLVMKLLLQKRHLAPTHASTLYIPNAEDDPLVIEKVPDFFISGHIHRSAVISHNNVAMIAASSWQNQTPFQDKVGHVAEPGRVPIVNLKTREVSVLNFYEDEPSK
ncbi:MAG: metallophosphoesterase [Candidatus Nanoarchaeia archaeon]|nr:metallophosphoesterase [Candidatus Nanoarchaeia archaeon]